MERYRGLTVLPPHTHIMLATRPPKPHLLGALESLAARDDVFSFHPPKPNPRADGRDGDAS